MSSSGIRSGSGGVLFSGGMIEALKLQKIAELIGRLDANQMCTLYSRCYRGKT